MDISGLEHIVNGIIELKPPVLLIVVLNGLGFLLKTVKWFPNNYIPVALVAVGTFTFPMMYSKSSLVLDVYNPNLYAHVLGFALGLAATGLYELLKNFNFQDAATGMLKSWVAKIIPGAAPAKPENNQATPPNENKP